MNCNSLIFISKRKELKTIYYILIYFSKIYQIDLDLFNNLFHN